MEGKQEKDSKVSEGVIKFRGKPIANGIGEYEGVSSTLSVRKEEGH